MQDSFNPYAAPPPAQPEPANVRPSTDQADLSLRTIAVGLDMVRASLILFLVDLVALMALVVLFQLGEVPRHIQKLVWFGNESVLILAQCLALAGTSRCLNAMRSGRANALAAATVVAQMLSLIVSIGAIINVHAIGGRNSQDLLAAVACMAFILFLRKLAQFLDRPDLAHRAAATLVVWCVLAVSIVTVLTLTLITIYDARHSHPMRFDIEIYAAAGLTMFLLAIGAVLALLKLLAGMKSALLEQTGLPAEASRGAAETQSI